MSDPGFWLGLIGTVVAVGTLGLNLFEFKRTARRDDVHEHITYLNQRLEDMQQQNELCEMRCDELREQVLRLMAESAAPSKRRRKVATADT